MVAASEVSSILESRISGTAVGGNVEETGRVLSTFFSVIYLFDGTNIGTQALVMVLDAFGACGMSKVCSLVL
jgi:F-type H+-transporting ATPase subunit alpha